MLRPSNNAFIGIMKSLPTGDLDRHHRPTYEEHIALQVPNFSFTHYRHIPLLKEREQPPLAPPTTKSQ